MTGTFAIGDLVQLRADGFGGPDPTTKAANLEPGRAYRIDDLITDRRGVTWIKLAGVPAPSRRYPGWATLRFERVGAYDDASEARA